MSGQGASRLDIGGKLLLIGAGKMGGAMLEGWLELGLDPALVGAIDPGAPPEVAAMLARVGATLNPDLKNFGKPAVVLLAIKPQKMAEALSGLAPVVGGSTLVVSIMAGKTIAGIAGILGADVPIVRAMPNTPAAVGRGITVAVPNGLVTPDQRAAADALLKATGAVEWVDDESLIDAVTAVSGSGPAYVFHLVETLAAAGVAVGLPEALAMRLARATVAGSGELLHRSSETAEILRRNVTSPAGTTAAALDVLMADDGLAPLMKKAVAAAHKRAQELGG